MAKLPAFQFYPGDWIQDTRALTLAAKGAWIVSGQLTKLFIDCRRFSVDRHIDVGLLINMDAIFFHFRYQRIHHD